MSPERPDESPEAHAVHRRSEPRDPLADLLPKVLRGDAAAEKTLLTAVGPSVLAVVRRIVGTRHPDTEDLCQESFLAFLSALPTFRGQCTVLHFACRVAVFTTLAARRRHRFNDVRKSEPLAEADWPSPLGGDPAELAEQREIRETLRKLLDVLPLHQSEVLAAHVLLGHTVEEVADMTECGVNTVRSRLRRGLEALRQAIASRSDLYGILRGIHE